MKISIYGKKFNKEFNAFINEFFQHIYKHQVELYIYAPFYKFLTKNISGIKTPSGLFESRTDAPSDINFLLSIGGDGTFLESMSYLKDLQIPLVGLNSGRLGFLANISKEEISQALEAMVKGDYEIENRHLIEISNKQNTFGEENLALNEVTIQKKDSTMITVDTYLDNEFLNTYWTDGLIIATPTGSTAYSLSVGGPILMPGSDNIIIAPIASHNLSVRPLVVPIEKRIKLVVRARSGQFLVTADNRTIVMNSMENEFIVQKSLKNLKMLKFPFNNYFLTLRSKLMWGADKRN